MKDLSLRGALREIGSPVEDDYRTGEAGEADTASDSDYPQHPDDWDQEEQRGSWNLPVDVLRKIDWEVGKIASSRGEDKVKNLDYAALTTNRLDRQEADERSREALMERAERALGAALYYPKFKHMDFNEMDVEDESVNLILTDPPYPKKHLPLWEGLGEFAARVLKSDGWLVTYAGSYHLPDELAPLNRRLSWRWLLGARHGGKTQRVLHRGVYNRFKPILVFSKGAKEPKNAPIEDLLWIGDEEGKGRHPWGQSAAESEKLILAYTHPEELVCDPFVGGGTVLLASMLNGRRSIGAEIDRETYEATMKIIEEAWDTARESEAETRGYRPALPRPRTPLHAGEGTFRGAARSVRERLLVRTAFEDSEDDVAVAAAIARGLGRTAS